MVWIAIILVLIIVAAIHSTKKPDNYTEKFSEYEEYPDDLSKEEIEYDYLQRMEEEQEEEDYYIQQMDDE
jgi:hypothetical protein